MQALYVKPKYTYTTERIVNLNSCMQGKNDNNIHNHAEKQNLEVKAN